MTLPLVYLPEARDDLDAAYADYERRSPGLGERFVDAVRDRALQIRDNPEPYGVVYQDVRAAPVRRFPFVISYQVELDRILVIAVQRGSRDWSNWQSRV